MEFEPLGEAAYVGCLLAGMARAPRTPVEIASGQPLPEISDLPLRATEDLHWVNTLVFKYDRLDPDLVIKMLLKASRRRWFQLWAKDWRFLLGVPTSSGESKIVLFWLSLTKTKGGGRVLRIEKLSRDRVVAV